MEWIAHRGLIKDCTENTLASFEAAVAAGFLTLETDLRVSADGDIVLCHDHDFSRIGGSSTPVEQLKTSEILKFELNEHAAKPMLFEEFIEKFAGFDWVLDIKPETAGQVANQLVERFGGGKEKAWFEAHVSFVTWNPSVKAHLRQAFKKARFFQPQISCYRAGIAALVGFPALGGIKLGEWYSLTPRLNGISLFTQKMVRSYHDRGAKVLAFLPENNQDIEDAVQSGFDALLCDWKGPKS